jgi:hypothetical protein
MISNRMAIDHINETQSRELQDVLDATRKQDMKQRYLPSFTASLQILSCIHSNCSTCASVVDLLEPLSISVKPNIIAILGMILAIYYDHHVCHAVCFCNSTERMESGPLYIYQLRMATWYLKINMIHNKWM